MRKSLLALGIACLLVVAMMPSLALSQQKLTLPGIPNPKVAVNAKEIGRYGGTLVFSSISPPRTFNYRVAQETSSGDVLGLAFDGLVETNWETAEVEPSLAESWTVSPDGRTWTFKLRRGVQWHDGTEFTSADVDFSFRSIFTEGVQTSDRDVLTFAGKPVEWRVIDKYTVQFRTPEPVGPFLRVIGTTILPKHRLEAALAKGGAEFNKTWGVDTPAREIVGTGPFQMFQYIPGQRTLLTRSTKYWKVDKKGNRLPYLARVVVEVVPNLEAARLKFEARETDIYGVRPVEYAAYKAREKEGNYTLYDIGPATGTTFITFNQNPAGVKPPKLDWFTNQKFRQAVSHAIDRDSIIKQVFAGRGVPLWGPLSQANRLYYNDTVVKKYPYDLRRAEQLLAEAGFRRGSDGVLRDSNNNVVEFLIATNAGNTEREAVGNILTADLRKLGMRATFAPEAFNTLVNKLVGTFNFDAIIIGLTAGPEPVTGRNVWHSSGSLHMWRPKQEKAVTAWEEEIDRLFDQAQITIDANKRKEIYARWQAIVSDQLPLIYFPTQSTQTAVRNTLANIRPRPYGGSIWNLEEIFYTQVYR